MTDKAGEPTAAEKIQSEYNQNVGLLGHNIAQQMTLQKEEMRLRGEIQKIVNRAANLPKEKIQEVKENGSSNETRTDDKSTSAA